MATYLSVFCKRIEVVVLPRTIVKCDWGEASERSKRDTLRSVQSRIADIYIYYARKMVPMMGRASS